MDSRICLASDCDALNTKTQEAQCNVQMFPPTIKQETLQCCDEKETNCDNHMSLKSSNRVNYYDDQFCVSTEVKEEEIQSSTVVSCINKSVIDSYMVFENEELSKVLETQEIKQEVSQEAFSFIKTEEIHDINNKFIAKTEMSEEYRILGSAGDTSVLYKVETFHQEAEPKMCGGILKNKLNLLTHNNERIKTEPPTLVANEGNELHKCQLCDEYFYYNNMLPHVDDVHSHKKHKSELYHKSVKKMHAARSVHEINYKCDPCKRTYKSKFALVSHFKKIHYSYGRIFKCWCGKQFRTPKYLSNHKYQKHRHKIEKATLKKKFQCDICKKIIKSKRNLEVHITSMHYDYGKSFKCWCGKQFRTPKYLSDHKYRQHCPKIENATQKKLFQCDICKKMFISKGNLIKHIKGIHYDYSKTFECWCGKQFRTPRYLSDHKYRQHRPKIENATQIKLFQCDICKKMFKSKSNLRTHITTIHYGNGKRFECWCGKQFPSLRYLSRHKHKQHGPKIENSTQKKIFQCDICKKMFIRKGNLIKHITSIHYDYGKTFECWCGKQFRTPIHLNDHKYRQHGPKIENATQKKIFQCDICKKIIKNKGNLKRHITNIHYDYGRIFES